MQQTFTKDDLQREAYEAWASNDYKGLIAAATGAGKTKLGIMAAEEVYSLYGKATDIVLVAPFIKLLTETWPAEFKLWGMEHLLPHVTMSTYVSLGSQKKGKRSLIILDEAHHLTARAAKFFDNNAQDRILMLSATPVESRNQDGGSNADVINGIAPIVYRYSLDQGTADGLIADYKIWVVDCSLDSSEKYIPAGTKTEPFLTTEASGYAFIIKKLKKAMATKKMGWVQALVNERMHFIYNLRSKANIAKKILKRIPPSERTIIFCGSIDQANEVCAYVYHSRSGDEHLTAFKNQEINVIAVVKAVDEGHNLPNVDNEIIIQASSVPRQTVQRIGRSVRFRPNHIARIFILCTAKTADVKWVKSGLEQFDKKKIFRYSSKNL